MSQSKRKALTKTHHHAALESPPRSSQLLTVAARVRAVELTPLAHVSVVLDTPAGRLKALSDAASVHLPELRAGTPVQAVLLRFHRATPDAVWRWQLLCCRALSEAASLLADTSVAHERSAP